MLYSWPVGRGLCNRMECPHRRPLPGCPGSCTLLPCLPSVSPTLRSDAAGALRLGLIPSPAFIESDTSLMPLFSPPRHSEDAIGPSWSCAGGASNLARDHQRPARLEASRPCLIGAVRVRRGRQADALDQPSGSRSVPTGLQAEFLLARPACLHATSIACGEGKGHAR